jgi:hypothetical protein
MMDRDQHSEKHCSQSLSTDAGIPIDESEEERKARRPIHESRESGSNATIERAGHSAKQYRGKPSRHEGMQMDESDEQSENAAYSIDLSLESGANVTVASERQFPKQLGQIRVTEEGIQIEEREEHVQNA